MQQIMQQHQRQHHRQLPRIQQIIQALEMVPQIQQMSVVHRIVHQCKIIVKFSFAGKLSKFYLCFSIIFFTYRSHSSSNFKRQYTIDSASMKENSARLAQNQRPASAQPKAVSSTDSTYLFCLVSM